MQLQQTISVVLLGDVSLNGHWSSDQHDPFGDKVTQMIAGHDVVLLNLESSIKGDKGENELKAPRLNTTEAAVLGLRALHPTVCVLGNNHCYDNLDDGLSKTILAVEKIGALPAGVRDSQDNDLHPVIFKKKGSAFSLLSYVAGDTHPNLPPGCDSLLRELDVDAIIADVKEERNQGRFVIVSLHWGREFEKYPTPEQRRTAQRIAEAGAHIIWGHHAHVCQGWEFFQDCPVFYSIGNTVFDDLPGISWNSDSRQSLLVSLSIDAHTGKVLKETMRVSMLKRMTSTFLPTLHSTCDLEKMLCRPLTWKSYHLLWRIYQAWLFMKRVYFYFNGPERKPHVQFLRLPGQILSRLRFIYTAKR